MNDGRTNVVTLDFDRINYGLSCLGHARYVYSRDELLQIRCCVSGVSSPIFDGYKSMLFNGTKAKYRCRAGKKVKERLRYLSNSIPVVVKPCSSRYNHSRENLHALNKTRKLCCSIVEVKLVDLPGPTKPTIIPKCMVINARSLVKPDAAAALYCDLKSNETDICLVSETWLNSNVPSYLVCPDGFTIIRKDVMTREWAVVLLYFAGMIGRLKFMTLGLISNIYGAAFFQKIRNITLLLFINHLILFTMKLI